MTADDVAVGDDELMTRSEEIEMDKNEQNARAYVIAFAARSDGGPSTVGPFPSRHGAEAHLADLTGKGFSAESEIRAVGSVIDSIRAVSR